jgi:hypothetical protein
MTVLAIATTRVSVDVNKCHASGVCVCVCCVSRSFTYLAVPCHLNALDDVVQVERLRVSLRCTVL